MELVSNAELRAEKAQKLTAFSGLNLHHVRSEVSEALSHFGRIGVLEEYTKHDITHIDSMLAMYDWLIPQESQAQMTSADWLLLTLSTYFHDFGLLVTREEFDAREDLPAFLTYKKRILENDDPSVQDYRSQVAQMEQARAEEFLYQEFVRENHASRIRGWLRDSPDSSLGGDPNLLAALQALLRPLEETFRDDLGTVCESHHLDDLNNLKKYPISRPYGSSSEEEANVQYAALMLRTSDLLHITKDRVPSMAALVINPRNPKSQTEWAKQRAVRSVRPKPVAIPEGEASIPPSDTVEVHATFKDSEGYFGLTTYLSYASRELAQTFAWSKDNQTHGRSALTFPWRNVSFQHIEAKGFVAEPFEFKIDQGKILDLLTGHTLYNDTGVVVRELVQNSLDAVRLQDYLSTGSNYKPRVDIRWDPDSEILEITDNGIGMTQDVIEKNFLRVGSSRYQEPDFKKSHPDFTSISRFGIGVLSTFMVADNVSVTTSSESEDQARQLSLRDVHGQYLVRLLKKDDVDVPASVRKHGTSVVIKLRPSAQLDDVEAILRHWIVVPGCEVTLTIGDDEPKEIGFDSTEAALKNSLISADLARPRDGKLVNPYGSEVRVVTEVTDGTEVSYAVAWSRWLEEWGYVRYDPNEEDPFERSAVGFGTCIGGVRVTSGPPGYASGGIAAIANATGPHAPRTNVARSAIEKTDEYDNLLRRVFAAYVGHIGKEVAAQVDRRASVTRAAQEARFLAEDVARPEPASHEVRREVLRTAPFMIVEDSAGRSLRTLEDLEAFDELVSIESTTISHYEQVLQSVRGAPTTSLRNLMAALNSDETLPTATLVCGLGRGGLVNSMFTSEWEVAGLETDGAKRTLSATWRRKGDTPRWLSAGRRTSLPPTIATRIEREQSLGRGNQGVGRILFGDSSIDVGAVQEGLVVCHGRLLVLPGHPFQSMKPVSAEIPTAALTYLRAWVAGTVTGFTPNRYGRAFSVHALDEATREQWDGNILKVLEDTGAFEILEEDSVRLALQSPDLEPLDVARWDRRTSTIDDLA
ncbi:MULTISPECIES: ATP-binding protein [unclassified Aeromicrobium]|uniref:HD domain-containing protein n=1 Tax=unclassified Aeromicrobium TaxID=2633570 RepID=UPI00396AFA57